MMKKILVASLAMASFFSVEAQETISAGREIYLSAESFNSGFGLTWKRPMNEQVYYRVGITNIHFNYQNYIPSSTIQFPVRQYSFRFLTSSGFEFRKAITPGFTFYHGPNFFLGSEFNLSHIENPAIPYDARTSESNEISPGIFYSFGFIVPIKGNFYFSSEVNPMVNLYFSRQFNGDRSNGMRMGLMNRPAMISLMYRI
jgi:hypothetical protein